MSLVALADYKTALKVGDDSEDAVLTQYSGEIDARIKAFLGYDIEETVYTEELYDGNGTQYLFPKAVPVTVLTKLEVYEGLNSDDSEDWEEWNVAGDEYTRLIKANGGFYLFIDGNVFPKGEQNIRLTYTAGYTSGTLPQDIEAVCKELMKIKYDKINKNKLGVPSISIGSASSTSQSYEADEDLILKKIEHYRFVR